MRVLLISANREKINMRAWPLGAACSADAVERAGHDVHLRAFMRSDPRGPALKKAVGGFHPEIIGASVRNVADQRMANLMCFPNEVRDRCAG